MWTFDSRRDKKPRERHWSGRRAVAYTRLDPPPPCQTEPAASTQTARADFDRWHSRCCRLQAAAATTFSTAAACNVRAHLFLCVCVCECRLGLGPIAAQGAAGCGFKSHVCRMSCKLAQLIYFNTNLTLISCVLHRATSQPRSSSASCLRRGNGAGVSSRHNILYKFCRYLI